MTTIDPHRLGELLDAPGSARTGEEEDVADLIVRLRGMEDEPRPDLADRVERIVSASSPPPAAEPHRARRSRPTLRRLPITPAVVAGGLALCAAVLGVVVGTQALRSPDVTPSRPVADSAGSPAAGGGGATHSGKAPAAPVPGLPAVGYEMFALGAGATPSTDPGRLQKLTAGVGLTARNAREVIRLSERARVIARGMGGFTRSLTLVADSDVDANANLLLDVPVDRATALVGALSRIAPLADANVQITDLGARVIATDARRAEIRRRLERVRADLAASPSDPALRRAVRLLEARLDAATAARGRVTRDGARAQVALDVTVPSAADPSRSRAERALDRAGSAWAQIGATALLVLIVAGPLLLLAGLAVWLHRRRAARP